MTYLRTRETYYKLIPHWCLIILGFGAIRWTIPIRRLIHFSPTMFISKINRNRPSVKILVRVITRIWSFINTPLSPMSWLISFYLIKCTTFVQISTLLAKIIPSAKGAFNLDSFWGWTLIYKCPWPLHILHHMLVISSVTCGRLLAPLVIFTSNSANFFVNSVKAKYCWMVSTTSCGFNVTFGEQTNRH